ncbi:MAG: hypothetical protein JKX90_08015 [Colwellia sp.]|jgi:hypothetical protein|nr:hypothetical protein [Colwellia sp.]
MLAILLITALFVVISVLLFFRAEKLQHSLLVLKRETTDTLKENKTLAESMVLIASKHEQFTKNRLQQLLANNKKHKRPDTAELIQPLINNYLLIFSQCLKKQKLQTITKKCFESQSTNDYKEFINKVIKNDVTIKRLWASNNLIGFISLVEALLVKYNYAGVTSVSSQDSNDCQKSLLSG